MDVETFDEIASTQAEAKRRIAERDMGHRSAMLLVARRQTAGIGRFGRAWESPRGGLWMTLAMLMSRTHDVDAPAHVGLGLRIGIACTRFVRDLLGGEAARHVQLRWPNDVVIDGRKVLGALCEIVNSRGNTWFVAGVGLNANLSAEQLPEPLRAGATTLREAGASDIDLGGAAIDLATRLMLAAQPGELTTELLEEARLMLWAVGQEASVSLPTGLKVCATLISLDARGDAVFEQAGSRWVAPSSVRIDG